MHVSGAKSVTTVVRTFVGALAGPTDLVGAFFTPSSYQLLCFVASFVLATEPLRSAVKTVAERSLSEDLLFVDEAVTAPVFFFLRLILWPASSPEESSLDDTVGVGGLSLMLPLAFAFLFLNVMVIGGGMSAGEVPFSFVSAMFGGELSRSEVKWK